eukprot:UN22843
MINNLNKEAKEGGHECVICTETKSILSVPPCGHPFCSKCLMNWLSRDGNKTCPNCRKPLKKSDIIEVDMTKKDVDKSPIKKRKKYLIRLIH